MAAFAAAAFIAALSGVAPSVVMIDDDRGEYNIGDDDVADVVSRVYWPGDISSLLLLCARANPG